MHTEPTFNKSDVGSCFSLKGSIIFLFKPNSVYHVIEIISRLRRYNRTFFNRYQKLGNIGLFVGLFSTTTTHVQSSKQ